MGARPWIAAPRASVRMQAVAEAIETNSQKTKYTPIEFENKFIKHGNIEENPLSQIIKISTDIKY